VWHFDKKRFFSVKSAYGTPILAEMLVPLWSRRTPTFVEWVLVNALNSSSHELSDIGVLLHEIRSNCIASFEAYFQFCWRESRALRIWFSCQGNCWALWLMESRFPCRKNWAVPTVLLVPHNWKSTFILDTNLSF
jgi:hypothetical protein